MNKLILGLLFITIHLMSWGQAGRYVNAFQFRGNMYPVGFDIEIADSDFKTIHLSVGIMGSIATVGNTEDKASVAFGLAPYTDVQYRWFYKLKREAKQGMKLRGNSGNFLAVRAEAKSDPLYDVIGQARSRFSAGVIWGLQRQYTTGFHLGFSIGFGYAVDTEGTTGFVPMGNIKVGWVIFHVD